MTDSRWMLYTKKTDFAALGKKYGVDPLIIRIICNRNVPDDKIGKYLNGGVGELYDPHLLKDMDRAVEILKEKLDSGKKIRIVGDYDIDGICATYILYRGFSRVGAIVDYEIPERIRDGYGINETIIRGAAKDGVDTIITCDNGISAISQCRLADELNMTVIVTDHHEISKEDGKEILPKAAAVVDPKRQDDHICPQKEICGGMIAWKLVGAIYEAFGIPKEEWMELAQYAAMATVGDVMPLTDENRILVRYGLERIKNTENQGLRALIEKNGIKKDELSAYHIGFIIGPCLNASGRLETAEKALNLLLEKSAQKADMLAEELVELNSRRKEMTAEGLRCACEEVERSMSGDRVLVVYLSGCHESLAGIIAGRLKEQYYKPVFVLTDGENAIKGSGRSIEPYHMYNSLLKVSDLLLKFGGHPMAAGLSMKRENIDDFRKRLNEEADLTPDDMTPKIWIDAAMPFEYINENLVEQLKILEPFGMGNEKPQFALKGLKIRSCRVMGRNRNAVRLSLADERGQAMDALWFGDGDAFLKEREAYETMDIVYYPDINEYNGKRSLQIVLKNYKF